MEKEKLSSDLKMAVGTTSMSEQSWNNYIDNVAFPSFPEDETKQADYMTRQVAYLKSQSGQYNKDIADRVNEAKKAFASQTPQQNQTPPPPIENTDEVPQWAKDLQKKFEDSESERLKEKNDANYKQRVSTLTSKIKGLGADNETVLNLIIGTTTFGENQSDEDCISQLKAKYDETYKSLYGNGSNPSFGGGSFSSGTSQADKDNYRKHLEDTGRIKKQ